MAYDSLIETTSPQSKLVGCAQGLYESACQHQLAIIMSIVGCNVSDHIPMHYALIEKLLVLQKGKQK
ncbi:hypothetical protein CUMW_217390 [Citrus unshiu]|uniref:Uncharacterized protein n=1 Tax=Citrus unshiu TaxID=55188 RepID=A0A2H5QCS7_CITUN|nr:hypothetical protein CUMW_217390 [Citrus unshiu]